METALQQNTIVCLGSGTGKTFIAVMLIKELAHQVRKLPKDEGQRKHTVLLVNTGTMAISLRFFLVIWSVTNKNPSLLMLLSFLVEVFKSY